jgi:cation diffusion facilitator CzcD-associated flavoprotein CzcO
MKRFEPPGRIAILGAGFAGLGAAEALKRHGIEYDQFDRNPGLGGIWHEGSYAGLHLITPKRTTGYRKFPMPDDYPEFPSGKQVRRYLENFAHQHGLMASLYLGQAASRVQPVGDGTQWRVQFDSGEERLYAGVIAATGHHWLPRYPYVEGSFSGTQLHSSEYRSPTVLRGKRVLVVGGGNSAADIAVAAVHAAGVSHISISHGHWILPKSIRGRPVGEMLKSWMPLWLLRRSFRACSRSPSAIIVNMGWSPQITGCSNKIPQSAPSCSITCSTATSLHTPASGASVEAKSSS